MKSYVRICDVIHAIIIFCLFVTRLTHLFKKENIKRFLFTYFSRFFLRLLYIAEFLVKLRIELSLK